MCILYLFESSKENLVAESQVSILYISLWLPDILSPSLNTSKRDFLVSLIYIFIYIYIYAGISCRLYLINYTLMMLSNELY